MNPRLWWALGAFALALALLAPALAPLPASMDQFAGDLANGTFRPFGPPPGTGLGPGNAGSLGGLSGLSTGNFVPGAGEVPPSWEMDRNPLSGNVVIDYVCNPSPGAMQRLKAYDMLGSDARTLQVADARLHTLGAQRGLPYDSTVSCSFPVQLAANVPVPIYSVAPEGYALPSYTTDPPLPGGLAFLKDGADTVYVLASETKRVTLNVTYLVDSDYFAFQPNARWRASDYPAGLVPALPSGVADAAKIVLARAGVSDATQVGPTLEALNAYFRGFTDGPIPGPDEVESLYLALALSGHGCCRHRAFAYMVTAQAAGIPTRVVVNEAHAFPEVLFPDGTWHQVNLGGCGTYSLNNPNNYPSLFDQAADPRQQANPDQGRPQTVVGTFTNITDAPARMVKGDTYFVNGTVEASNGRPVAGAPVDLYLNATKTTRGKLMTSGQSDANGRFAIQARVPGDVPAQGYQLVASAGTVSAGPLRYEASWSDPAVDVFTPTRIVLAKSTAAAGFPANATGRLVDVDGNPVGPARIDWTLQGVALDPVQADASGLFTARFLANGTGNVTLSFSYAGDAHHGPTTASESVPVDRGTVLLPAQAPELLRGQRGFLSGTVAIQGAQLGGRQVAVYLSLSNLTGAALARAAPDATGATDAGGHFVASFDVPPRAAPGVYNAIYVVRDLNVTATGLAQILVKPTLAIDVPARIGPAQAWTALATVASDDGSPIAGGIVELRFDRNASAARTLLTNASGVARFEMGGGALPAGDHQVSLVFAGDRVTATATQDATLRVLPPFWALIPPWAWLALLAVLLVAGLVALLLRPQGAFRRVVLRPRWRVELSWPGFEPGMAPMAEPGGALRVRARLLDAQGRERRARFLVQTAGQRVRTRDEATLDAPQEEGALALDVRPGGRGRWLAAPAHARVPVATYRRAVEDGFVALRARAGLDPSATPDELVEALAPRAPRESLVAAARLFELADFSEVGVDRAFYDAFAAARRDVEEAIARG
ncbi:MAG: hypothetical protein QOE90_3757 [Thermoplasmata archaeon]|nr:hypothetical protein [Thermoplasmata archaeon]